MTLALAALILLACGDETPTSPDDAALKKGAVTTGKTDSASGDSLQLKRGALLLTGQPGMTKESSVCGARKRELAAVRGKLTKGATPQLRNDEVSLFAIVSDVCN
jgi:hypothetical protein